MVRISNNDLKARIDILNNQLGFSGKERLVLERYQPGDATRTCMLVQILPRGREREYPGATRYSPSQLYEILGFSINLITLANLKPVKDEPVEEPEGY